MLFTFVCLNHFYTTPIDHSQIFSYTFFFVFFLAQKTFKTIYIKESFIKAVFYSRQISNAFEERAGFLQFDWFVEMLLHNLK